MNSRNHQDTAEVVNEIINFLDSNGNFEYSSSNQELFLKQIEDKKTIKIAYGDIEKVLSRQDFDGSRFIQVNYKSGIKMLITKSLVGFKPNEAFGIDQGKIPRVVTTVDLISVTKAIEDLYSDDDTVQSLTEIEVLKKVFQSIVVGAENIGFDMRAEKLWYSRFLLNSKAVSA